MNKKDVEKITERISELTQRWEDNRAKIAQLQREIMQRQQEVQLLLEMDQSLRGGLSELERILRSQAPKEEKKEGNPEEKEEQPDG